MKRTWIAIALLAALPVAAQQDYSKVEVKTQKLTNTTYMLTGAGGNIGVCVGDDAVFVVDDQFAPMAPKIQAAIAAISPKPVTFILNTHWHGDHTGGNVTFGQSGAVILAHDNVRQRLSAAELEQKAKEKPGAKPGAGLPVVTFAQDVTLHLNGDTVHVFHVPPAHTDGDVVVHFTKANVIHTGDLFLSRGYPFVDLGSGGSFEGFIRNRQAVVFLIG